MNINTITISGNLGQDATVRMAGQSSIIIISVGTTRAYKRGEEWVEETTWFPVELWSRNESLIQKLKRGTFVVVTGRMQCDSYEKDGVQKKAWKLVGHAIDFRASATQSDKLPWE